MSPSLLCPGPAAPGGEGSRPWSHVSVFPKMQVVHGVPAPAPHPRRLGPNQCHLRPLQSKTQPGRAQRVAGATQHPGEGRAGLPAADRGAWGPLREAPPPKGNQKLLQNRKKAQDWPEPRRKSSGKQGCLGPPLTAPPRRPREPLWCLHTAEVCALLQKDPSDPSGLKAARAPVGSPRPEPQCLPP